MIRAAESQAIWPPRSVLQGWSRCRRAGSPSHKHRDESTMRQQPPCCWKFEAEQRQREEDEIELNEQRRVADQLHIVRSATPASGGRSGAAAPRMPMAVPNRIESTANSMVRTPESAVEMHEDRAELQGGLHGHPVMARITGPGQAPQRRFDQNTGSVGRGWLRYFIDSSSRMPSVFMVIEAGVEPLPQFVVALGDADAEIEGLEREFLLELLALPSPSSGRFRRNRRRPWRRSGRRASLAVEGSRRSAGSRCRAASACGQRPSSPVPRVTPTFLPTRGPPGP